MSRAAGPEVRPGCPGLLTRFPTPRSNVLKTWDDSYFKRCRYDPHLSPYCPIFGIGDLVTRAGGDFEDLALRVGVWAQICRGGQGAGPGGEHRCAVCRVAP